MAIDFKPEQNDYTNLTPFKTWLIYQINTWGVNNFPFLENDFDQLTNYGMMMKLMKAMNDTIGNQNKVEDDMSKLYEAFTELQTYIDNYFENLDVQEEVNNKLDEMASDGTLEEIINQEIFGDINQRLDNLEATKTMIVIGDSYSNNAQSETPLWYTYVSKWLGLNVYTNASDGVGYATGNNSFLTQLTTANNHFTDKSGIDRIYIVGGLNDLGNNSLTVNDFLTAVNNTLNYALTNFPNISIYVVGIFPFQYYNFYSGESGLATRRAYDFEKNLSYACGNKNVCFIPAGTIGLNCNDFFGTANQYNQKHPSARGEKIIANYIMTGTQIGGASSLTNTNWNTTPYTLTNGENTTLTFNSLSNDCIIVKIDNYDNTQQLVLDLSCFPTHRSYAKVRHGVEVHVANIDSYVLSINANNVIPSGTIYIEIPLCFDPKTYIR